MKKSIIFISISLGLIIMLGIGVSYSMWNISVSQDTTNMAESKCFDLSISNKENNISLENAYPISNDKGKSLTPYTFTVTNTCDITAQYNINLEVLNSSTLASKFIDVMFEGNINLLSSYDTTDKVNTSSIESKKLTTGILKSQESKDYSLRLWIDYNTTLEDLNNEIKSFKSKIVLVGKPINYTGDTVFNFDYTGGEQTFVAPVSGTYRLETWGAQGGNAHSEIATGGNGGYSSGMLSFNMNSQLFISIGGSPVTSKDYDSKYDGGYNGGGYSYTNYDTLWGAGGGSTSISNILIGDGQLKNYENKIGNILIVSGGSGGAGWLYKLYVNDVNNNSYFPNNGGSGGGISGASGNTASSSISFGGTQTAGGKSGNIDNIENKAMAGFGYGASPLATKYGSGGGGGFYGGGSSFTWGSAGAGGSGYIGNSLLTNKVMYCYNCEESNEESTKTISTTCSEETPTSYCAKKGNGYARITLVSIDE